MTLAWYGHLKFFKGGAHPLIFIILISWGIAFFEYCFQVPANRIGYQHLSATQLKVIQEVITLVIFVVFATRVLGEPMKWNHWVAFGLIAVAVYFATAFK
jgi:uncharacterized protein (DUF486 family)